MRRLNFHVWLHRGTVMRKFEGMTHRAAYAISRVDHRVGWQVHGPLRAQIRDHTYDAMINLAHRDF